MIAATQAFDPALLVRDYGDVEDEVRACREKAALFDFSFMSVARVSGPDAVKAISRLTDRDLGDLAEGRIRYALSRNPNGWLRSDLTVWKEATDSFMVMSGLKHDITVLEEAARTVDVTVKDLSQTTAVFAVQGPQSLAVLNDLGLGGGLGDLPYFGFWRFEMAGVPCFIGRLGYTGERGFEIVFPESPAPSLWARLSGRARPGGFAAADCLRIEAGFVLFSNEFRLPVRAEEAGLGRFADDDARPARYRLVCFKAESLEPPVLWSPPEILAAPEAGAITVTSACHSALAGGVLGLGYVLAAEPIGDGKLTDPSGRFSNITEVPRPFYDPSKERPRGDWR